MEATIHMLIRIADSCGIETYVVSETDKNGETVYNEFVNNDWKHSYTRKVKMVGMYG